ncbi:hypothetical protein V1509DRAFT_623159 [Lipomyces kononenkoae]
MYTPAVCIGPRYSAMQQSAVLAYVRDAVLDGTVTEVPGSTSNYASMTSLREDIGQVREEISRLAAYLQSLNRQYSLQSLADRAVRLLQKLPSASDVDDDSTAVPSPQFVRAADIIPIQNQLIASQSTLISHYISLVQLVADSYVFPVSSIFEFSDPLDSINSKSELDLHFDADALLFTNTSGLAIDANSVAVMTQNRISKLLAAAMSRNEPEFREGMMSLEEHNNIVSSIASALDRAKSESEKLRHTVESENKEKENLQQTVMEFEASVLEISAKHRGQQDEIRRELTDMQARLLETQTELENQLALHLQKDENHARQLKQSQQELVPLPLQGPGASAPDVVKQLEAKNSELQRLIAQLETDMAAQAMQHGEEFETILMQNASLNEKLAEMDMKKSNLNSAPSSPIKSAAPATATASTEFLPSSGGMATKDRPNNADVLQSELRDLTSSYENLLSRSLEYENERVQLEREIASLRDKNQRLEAKVMDNRVKVLASHTDSDTNTENIDPNGSGSHQSESGTIGVLRKEFRKLVAEMKRDHATVMKAEFEERRRLEKVIRDMKRSAT